MVFWSFWGAEHEEVLQGWCPHKRHETLPHPVKLLIVRCTGFPKFLELLKQINWTWWGGLWEPWCRFVRNNLGLHLTCLEGGQSWRPSPYLWYPMLSPSRQCPKVTGFKGLPGDAHCCRFHSPLACGLGLGGSPQISRPTFSVPIMMQEKMGKHIFVFPDRAQGT